MLIKLGRDMPRVLVLTVIMVSEKTKNVSKDEKKDLKLTVKKMSLFIIFAFVKRSLTRTLEKVIGLKMLIYVFRNYPCKWP